MPLVHVDVLDGYTKDERATVGDCVHRAMTEQLKVPERDQFQLITAHKPNDFIFNRSYLDIARSDRFVLVTVTLSAGRTTDAKQAFYARLAELLAEAIGLSSNDLAMVLVENQREDWSFGRGEASYLVLPPTQWR